MFWLLMWSVSNIWTRICTYFPTLAQLNIKKICYICLGWIGLDGEKWYYGTAAFKKIFKNVVTGSKNGAVPGFNSNTTGTYVDIWPLLSSVGDPWHLGADPDPNLWLMDPDLGGPKTCGLLRIRIQNTAFKYEFPQCGGPGMFIPDLGSWFLPIPDPGSRTPDPGSKNSNKRER